MLQAHIHLGAKAFNGGIMVFLCSNLPDPPPGTQPCPVPSGTVSGSFSAEDVIGPEGQGISPGEFEEAIRALRVGRDLRERPHDDKPRRRDPRPDQERTIDD